MPTKRSIPTTPKRERRATSNDTLSAALELVYKLSDVRFRDKEVLAIVQLDHGSPESMAIDHVLETARSHAEWLAASAPPLSVWRNMPSQWLIILFEGQAALRQACLHLPPVVYELVRDVPVGAIARRVVFARCLAARALAVSREIAERVFRIVSLCDALGGTALREILRRLDNSNRLEVAAIAFADTQTLAPSNHQEVDATKLLDGLIARAKRAASREQARRARPLKKSQPPPPTDEQCYEAVLEALRSAFGQEAIHTVEQVLDKKFDFIHQKAGEQIRKRGARAAASRDVTKRADVQATGIEVEFCDFRDAREEAEDPAAGVMAEVNDHMAKSSGRIDGALDEWQALREFLALFPQHDLGARAIVQSQTLKEFADKEGVSLRTLKRRVAEAKPDLRKYLRGKLAD